MFAYLREGCILSDGVHLEGGENTTPTYIALVFVSLQFVEITDGASVAHVSLNAESLSCGARSDPVNKGTFLDKE